MRTLYPEIEPYNSLLLERDEIHAIYVEESGNKDGIPVIFLHGGPGSGCNENHRRYFDPGSYRIVIFDQRGTNRSRPAGCTENNTVHHLIADIESIRNLLGIDRWLLFGGSWGATLGLLYAQAYPEMILGMILRGTFLARQQDLEWFAKSGVNRIFPDYWQEFIDPIPDVERKDLVSAYYNRLHGKNDRERYVAARAWSTWAGRIVTYLLPDVDPDAYAPEDMDKTIREVLIETHYAKNHYFIEENQILDNIDKLPDIPVILIHGRKDLTCTVDASWELHKQLPNSQFLTVREGGHLAGEAVMTDALVTATDKMAQLLV